MSFLRRRRTLFVTRDKLLAGTWEKRWRERFSARALSLVRCASLCSRLEYARLLFQTQLPAFPSLPLPPSPCLLARLQSLSSYSDSVARWHGIVSARAMNFMEMVSIIFPYARGRYASLSVRKVYDIYARLSFRDKRRPAATDTHARLLTFPPREHREFRLVRISRVCGLNYVATDVTHSKEPYPEIFATPS